MCFKLLFSLLVNQDSKCFASFASFQSYERWRIEISRIMHWVKLALLCSSRSKMWKYSDGKRCGENYSGIPFVWIPFIWIDFSQYPIKWTLAGWIHLLEPLNSRSVIYERKIASWEGRIDGFPLYMNSNYTNYLFHCQFMQISCVLYFSLRSQIDHKLIEKARK